MTTDHTQERPQEEPSFYDSATPEELWENNASDREFEDRIDFEGWA